MDIYQAIIADCVRGRAAGCQRVRQCLECRPQWDAILNLIIWQGMDGRYYY